jgi:RNA methyltransferase, TrmH family
MLVKSQVKYIQSLSHKKHREEEGVFIAEGPKIIKELLAEYPAGIKQIFATNDWIINNKRPPHIELIEIDDSELERISQLHTAHQVLAIVQQFPKIENIKTRGQLTLVLDTIQDPGNFGTIIRIADWFGISQVVCNQECADIYNPKVVQATMGSIARVNVVYTRLMEWLLGTKGVHIFATGMKGKPVDSVGKINEGIIIIGNESRGIDETLLRLAHSIITIPKKGKAESLNAAIATGIVLAQLC